MRNVPLSFDEKVAAFGDPREYMDDSGHVSADWERKIVSYAQLPSPLALSWNPAVYVRRFKCHHRLVAAFERALRTICADIRAWESVNDFGGCYEFRANRRDRTALSAHAWGIAIDLDVCDNPQGAVPRVEPAVVHAFEAEGFAWGGFFSGKARDGMHFEFVDPARL